MERVDVFTKNGKMRRKTETVRHFFPWWMEPRYVAASADAATLNDEERKLIAKETL